MISVGYNNITYDAQMTKLNVFMLSQRLYVFGVIKGDKYDYSQIADDPPFSMSYNKRST